MKMTCLAVFSPLLDAIQVKVINFSFRTKKNEQSIKSGFCYCKDAPDVEVDIRMQMIREVMDLCPRGEMNRCLCRDNSKITFPFTIMDIMNCEPKKVGPLSKKKYLGVIVFV